jgi:hypothetical protein
MATVHPQQPSHHYDIPTKVPLNAPHQSSYSVPSVRCCSRYCLSVSYFSLKIAATTANKERPVLWLRVHRATERTLHNASLCMSSLPPAIHTLAGETPLFHCLCPPPHQAAPGRYLRDPRLAAALKGTVPHHTRLVWPPPLHFRLHDCLQGYLRHLFK